MGGQSNTRKRIDFRRFRADAVGRNGLFKIGEIAQPCIEQRQLALADHVHPGQQPIAAAQVLGDVRTTRTKVQRQQARPQSLDC